MPSPGAGIKIIACTVEHPIREIYECPPGLHSVGECNKLGTGFHSQFSFDNMTSYQQTLSRPTKQII